MNKLSIPSPHALRHRDRQPRLDQIRAVLSVGSLEPGLAGRAWAPYVEARDHFRTWATPATWARLVAASRQMLVTTQAERRAS